MPAEPYTPDPADAVRVIVVVNWRRERVHGITCEQEQAQRWILELVAKYDGDPLAATQTAGLVYPGAAAGRLQPAGDETRTGEQP